MKKLSLLITFMLLIGMATSVHATVDVPCFDGIFERATGAPVAKTVNFPGIAGSATIRVYNGAEDDSFEKVSSSIIMVNGVEVLTQESFNQNVDYLETEILLAKVNTISVEVRGKPGGKIRIAIIQSMEVDGAAFIGNDGGIIEAVDSQGNLLGTKVVIPEGAIDEIVLISIKEATQVPYVPNSLEFISPIVEFEPDGLQFNHEIEITVPFPFDDSNRPEYPIAVSYDPINNTWELILPSEINLSQKTIKFTTTHFSIKSILKILDISLIPDVINTDFSTLNTFPIDNPPINGGLCLGMSVFSNWYDKNIISPFLRDAYIKPVMEDLATSAHIAVDEAYGDFFNKLLKFRTPEMA